MEASTIVFIHEYLTDFFAESGDPIRPPGVKNLSHIESAAGRPFSSAGGRDAYGTVFEKAAALFHSVACNHGFHNGNKRSALLSTVYFLSENGYLLEKCSDDELYEFTRRIAAHELCEDRRDETSEIASWLEGNCRKQQRGERQMKLGDLREALGRFGYDLRDDGYTLSVMRQGKAVESIVKRGAQGFEDYDKAYIAELRKRLELTPEFGVDSLRFYGNKGLPEELGSFMRIRVDVMRRLALI